MTDKERLEEIDKRAKHRVLENIRGEVRYRLTEINTKDYEWLIEQAERGVEYDRYLISLEDNKHYVTGLEQQNKRYQKAIKECLECMNEGGAGTRSFVYEKLIEALEGESNELG